MTERGVGRPWTKDEDALLVAAVDLHGEVDNWKTVALCVPGRTNKACRKRWLHSLSPSVKKTAWTREEDEQLLALYAKHGTKWSLIARQIPGRTDDACSKRYREALDPSLRREEWTPQEDSILLDIYSRIGGKWQQVGQELNRSSLACRNRWRMLQRKKATNPLQGSGSTLPSVSMAEQIGDTATPWMPSMPYGYWDPQAPYASSSLVLHDHMPGQFPIHDPTFLPTQYSSPTESADYHCDAGNPPPFQFTSSSLSTALSLSSQAPRYSDPPTDEQHFHGEASPISSVQDSSPSSPPSQEDLRSPSHDSPDEPRFPSPVTLPASISSPLHPLHEIAEDTGDSCIDRDAVAATTTFSEEPSTSNQPRTYVPTCQVDTDNRLASHDSSDSSSTRYYRTTAQKIRASVEKPSPYFRKNKDSASEPRLSATMPVASGVHAYVCGHDSCWPATASESRHCFLISQELYNHWKAEHSDDLNCVRPFRCGIAGCGKGWKSINGLQYHLQLSKVHFQQAVSSALLSQKDNQSVVDDDASQIKKKLHPCPRPDCPNQYKQLKGLKYHLAHGHREEVLPTQLEVVPPALARRMAEKLQKMAPVPAHPE